MESRPCRRVCPGRSREPLNERLGRAQATSKHLDQSRWLAGRGASFVWRQRQQPASRRRKMCSASRSHDWLCVKSALAPVNNAKACGWAVGSCIVALPNAIAVVFQASNCPKFLSAWRCSETRVVRPSAARQPASRTSELSGDICQSLRSVAFWLLQESCEERDWVWRINDASARIRELPLASRRTPSEMFKWKLCPKARQKGSNMHLSPMSQYQLGIQFHIQSATM